MSSKTSSFSVCLCSSVCTSPHSSSLLCLPFFTQKCLSVQVEGVSKAILIILPVDCTGWKTVKDFFSALRPSLLIYGLSLTTSTFHPISIMVIFPQYRFNALIPLFYFSQECYSGSPVLFSCQLPMYFSTKEGEIWFKSGSFLLSDSGSQALGTIHSPSYGTCLYLHSHLLVKDHQPLTRYSSRFSKFGSGLNHVNFGRRDVPECISPWPVETDAMVSSTWEVPTCGLGMEKWFFVPFTSFIFLLCCMNILDQNNKKKGLLEWEGVLSAIVTMDAGVSPALGRYWQEQSHFQLSELQR